MVDALVLEASTSVCGFESHLPHQKKRAPKGAFFFWCPVAAGTSASLHVWQEPAVPPHTPPPFFVIPYSLRSKRTAPCHRQGAWSRAALQAFSLPQICAPVPADLNLPGSKKTPERVPSFGLYHRLPQDSPSRIHAAERHTKALPYSLFTRPTPAFPSRFPGAPEICSQQGGRRISSPAAMRDCKTPFPPARPRRPGTGSF